MRAINTEIQQHNQSTNSSSPPQREEPRDRNGARIGAQPVRGSQYKIETTVVVVERIGAAGVLGAERLASLEDLDLAHDKVRAGAFHHHAGAVAVVELPPASLVRVGARVWVRVSL